MKKSALLLLLLAQLQAFSQCLLREVPFDLRVSGASLVVEGSVISRQSYWNDDQTMIYTSNIIEVYKVFKGNITNDRIEVITEGGIVGLQMIKAEPSLQLEVGETGVFLCTAPRRIKGLSATANDHPRYTAFADAQGFIRYDLQSRTAADPFRKYADIRDELYKKLSPALNYRVIKNFDPVRSQQREMKLTAIGGFSPGTLTAGTGSLLTITGSGFGATQGAGVVRFRNADDGGATYITPLPSQYILWSDTEIRVEVPDNAGTGTIQVIQGVTFTSATSLTISYAHSNVPYDPGSGTIAYQNDHINNNGSGGYTWRMNTGFDANAAAKASFLRGFDSWRCGTDVNWTIGATTAVNDAVGDGINIITFDNAAPLGSGTLGVCYSYWSGCASGPNIVWFVNELDIIFDEGSNISPLTWEFGTATPSGTEYDFETVVVHELGHGHQLGHVIQPGAIMHYAISNGTSNRTPGVNDLAGGNFVQAKSIVANVCGPSAMAAYTGCSVLPIGITSINAAPQGKGILVEWTNASESEVNYYELEESGNGAGFVPAGRFNPKTNNGLSASYNWMDERVYQGYNYYRVKSVGSNGEIKYTPVVKVQFESSKQAFTIYPNPVKGNNIMLEFNNLEKGSYSLEVYNASGQKVMRKAIVHAGGNATEMLTLPALSSGLYHFRLKGKKDM
ncbi:MAG: T9SS type A sorting domain-containing protein, partial [Flavisolibacter sp.]